MRIGQQTTPAARPPARPQYCLREHLFLRPGIYAFASLIALLCFSFKKRLNLSRSRKTYTRFDLTTRRSRSAFAAAARRNRKKMRASTLSLAMSGELNCSKIGYAQESRLTAAVAARRSCRPHNSVGRDLPPPARVGTSNIQTELPSCVCDLPHAVSILPASSLLSGPP